METMYSYMQYLIQEEPIITDEGKQIEVFHLDIQDEPEIFEAWAKQFRRNYCSDEKLQHKMRADGLLFAENFSDAKVANNLMNVYKKFV